jgi:glycine hydroxymethyltransferase
MTDLLSPTPTLGGMGLFYATLYPMRDKAIERLIKVERSRQKRVVNLIPSENYVSQDVLAALGSEFNNKYAEGYPTKRYYGGNEVVDEIEQLCQTRALKLFKLKPSEWAVNVQPLSGSPANLAVYAALVPPGGKIMGMRLDHGGHLTHGHKASFTGKVWNWVHYGVDRDSELLDYAAIKEQAVKEKPALIVAGFTAYPHIIDFKKFREIANACGALLMVDMSHFCLMLTRVQEGGI